MNAIICNINLTKKQILTLRDLMNIRQGVQRNDSSPLRTSSCHSLSIKQLHM